MRFENRCLIPNKDIEKSVTCYLIMLFKCLNFLCLRNSRKVKLYIYLSKMVINQKFPIFLLVLNVEVPFIHFSPWIVGVT